LQDVNCSTCHNLSAVVITDQGKTK
jgi:hypothetical protein